MFGIGLRKEHYPHLEQRPSTEIDWFEAISENYMATKGRPLKILEGIRQDYPLALHGVGMSIASAEPLDRAYLAQLTALIKRLQPFIVSDHLCWTGTASHNLHDLLPFPFTSESLALVCQKISLVQDALQRPLVLENVSSYMTFANSEIPEWEFLAAVVMQTGCQLLLDLNNVYVNACNHRFDATRYLDALPIGSIAQLHLAGHIDTGEYLFDTHSRPVCTEVWALYEHIIAKLPTAVPTLIEWDADIPSFDEVATQALLAKEKWKTRHGQHLPT